MHPEHGINRPHTHDPYALYFRELSMPETQCIALMAGPMGAGVASHDPGPIGPGLSEFSENDPSRQLGE
jgi:hypothetical protein